MIETRRLSSARNGDVNLVRNLGRQFVESQGGDQADDAFLAHALPRSLGLDCQAVLPSQGDKRRGSADQEHLCRGAHRESADEFQLAELPESASFHHVGER